MGGRVAQERRGGLQGLRAGGEMGGRVARERRGALQGLRAGGKWEGARKEARGKRHPMSRAGQGKADGERGCG